MELMVKPVFKINDNITLTTQFTALQDHVWGDDANPNSHRLSFPLSAAVRHGPDRPGQQLRLEGGLHDH
jgi:hypothetical protein